MRKLLTFIIYTIVILLVGRNLTFLPRFFVFSTAQQQERAFAVDLKQQIQKTLKGKLGNYGIYYADLTKPYTFGINDKEMFTAASVNKVPIVAALYYLNWKGKIDLDEKITLQESDIQAYGTGSIQYADPGTVYSLKTLAKLSLRESDNTAAHILGERIGTDVIQQLVDSWGLQQTNMEENKSSPYDMYLLYKKIYKGEIASIAATKELFGFMLDTEIEDRLPSQLPREATVYHKTGDAVGSLHDVGIIAKDGTVFFLAVMTSDIGNKETETKQTIGGIAKEIFTSYSRKD